MYVRKIGALGGARRISTGIVGLLALVMTPGAVWGDPLDAGPGAIFRLGPAATFQEGCFPPCMCPIMNEQPIVGVMKMVYAGQVNGIHTYSVQDVNWKVQGPAGSNIPLRLTGSGMYRVGSPGAILVLQQRLELDLQDGTSNAMQHFDSGWVTFNQSNTGSLDIMISMNNMFCWDRAIRVQAMRVPMSEIQRYLLQPGSTYHHDCFGPCDCHIEDPRPMIGDFALVPLNINPLFSEFAVVDVQWLALSPAMNAGTPLHGFGNYRVGGEVAVLHQLSLELVVGNGPRTHFDSGLIPGGGSFPLIDIMLSMNNMVCVDTVLQVMAAPANGPVCGGIAGIPCPAGAFCKFPLGACCCDHQGICMPTPAGCPDVWDPVCGCDGVTYGNECDADMAGVSLLHRGPCHAPCGPNNTCPSGEFCKFPDGTCGAPTGGGLCIPIPPACPTIWNPVCGCDGVTYSNVCEADRAGVSIAHPGQCQQVCGGIAGIPCAPGEFCKFPVGTCQIADGLGVCQMLPTACPAIYAPVCGCDGITYPNECEADRVGAAINHYGPCALSCTAVRSFSNTSLVFCPGDTVGVQIALSPPAAAGAIALEDSPPMGWTVANISHNGIYDSVNHKVKWGPFFPPFPSAVTYVATPGNASDPVTCFAGVVSVDGTNEAICGSSCLDPCCPPMAADQPQPECSGCPVSGCNDCNAAVCQDGQVSLCELIGYACAWMTGCNDDISGMTRAAFVWRNGECYCWDAAAQNWVPTPCDPASGLCCAGSGSNGGAPGGAVGEELSGGLNGPAATTAGTVQASLEKLRLTRWENRSGYLVTAQMTPASGTLATGLEIEVPPGWVVRKISLPGDWEPVNRKVKWGPLMDNMTRTVSFTLHPVRTAAPTPKRSWAVVDVPAPALVGTASFDGVNVAFAVAE